MDELSGDAIFYRYPAMGGDSVRGDHVCRDRWWGVAYHQDHGTQDGETDAGSWFRCRNHGCYRDQSRQFLGDPTVNHACDQHQYHGCGRDATPQRREMGLGPTHHLRLGLDAADHRVLRLLDDEDTKSNGRILKLILTLTGRERVGSGESLSKA